MVSALLIAAAVVALYARTAGFGYVFDDEFYIQRNPGLALGLTWEGVRWAFVSIYHGNWHPLAWLAHFADRALIGPGPGTAHLVNAALHAACSALLFLLLRRLTGAIAPSIFAAAVFAVHPLRVESVAWVTERKDPLGAIFWILAAGAYLRYVRRLGRARYAVVAALFALGLMAKPSVITLPFVLLLLDFWPLGRWRSWGGRQSGGREGPGAARLLLEKLPLLALAAAAALVTFAAQLRIGAVMRLDFLPLPERIANALVATASYLGKTVWPTGLAVYYPHPQGALPAAGIAVAAAVVALATAGAFFWARRRPWLTTGWAWFLVTLAPTSGILQVGAQGMADRFTYLPSIGLAVALAWGGAELSARRPRLRPLVLPAAAAALGALALATWAQVGTWRDNATLYRHALAVTRDNWMVLNNYGTLIKDQGDLGGAIRNFRQAAALRPGFFEAHMNLGQALETAAAARLPLPDVPDPLAEALRHYRAAVELRPDSPEAIQRLRALLARRERDGGAAARLKSGN